MIRRQDAGAHERVRHGQADRLRESSRPAAVARRVPPPASRSGRWAIAQLVAIAAAVAVDRAGRSTGEAGQIGASRASPRMSIGMDTRTGPGRPATREVPGAGQRSAAPGRRDGRATPA